MRAVLRSSIEHQLFLWFQAESLLHSGLFHFTYFSIFIILLLTSCILLGDNTSNRAFSFTNGSKVTYTLHVIAGIDRSWLTLCFLIIDAAALTSTTS